VKPEENDANLATNRLTTYRLFNHRMFRRSAVASIIAIGDCGNGSGRGAVSNDEDADDSVIATHLITLLGFFIRASVLLSAVCARPNHSA